MKTALVFGANGQAGHYLCALLKSKDYTVIKSVRTLCDLNCNTDISDIIARVRPDEVYNMAGKMYAPYSWNNAADYIQVNGLAVGVMLETLYKINPGARFFNSGSAEVFDLYNTEVQNEATKIKPRNPYGVAKAMAQELVRIYRDEQKMFACTGIFFNMESPLRSDFFFTSKVAKAVAAIKAGALDKLSLGSLWAYRDWGLTEEYVEAAWLMLQSTAPNDYVIGTGESHSCLEFVTEAFTVADLDVNKYLEWDSLSNIGKNDILRADPTLIYQELGWRAKSKFKEVVKVLVENEIAQTLVRVGI